MRLSHQSERPTSSHTGTLGQWLIYLRLVVVLVELDGDRFQEAPELVGAVALCAGKEHPVPIVEGDADVLLFGALLVHLWSTGSGALSG